MATTTDETPAKKHWSQANVGPALMGITAIALVGCMIFAHYNNDGPTADEIAARAASDRAGAQQVAHVAKATATQPVQQAIEPDQDLINRCAGAAVQAGFLSASCGEGFMRVCVGEQSRSAMQWYVANGDRIDVLGKALATGGDGSYTPAFGNAILTTAKAADKFS